MLDTFDLDNREVNGELEGGTRGGDISAIHYDDNACDPISYKGHLAVRLLKKCSDGYGRIAGYNNGRFFACAHIVIGPDVETPLRKKELEPYPIEDFGGKLLSKAITYGGQSSREDDELNSQMHFSRMLSTENTIVAVIDVKKDLRGFCTKSEDSPWIQLDLDKQYTITGVQIDALSNHCYDRSRHLRVWTSEDGKVWREVAAENQRKHRYRFDLTRKNVKAKFIRIGREPGFMKDNFSLDKILVYGK